MKKHTILSLTLINLSLATLFLVSCFRDTGTEADKAQAEATTKALAEAQREVGMPNIINWQERKTLKMIRELCDQADLVCYAYLQNNYSGKLIYIGRCYGYGIPFSAQFTNPEKIVSQYLGNSVGRFTGVMPQADPNGLFMPTSSSATWLIMADPESKDPSPVYFEPVITVSPFKLTVGVEE